MATKPITKPFEVRFALALLRYLKGNVNNVYLLWAIIAWTRDTSGTTWAGNNPLKINAGKRYSTIEAAASATAKILLAGGNAMYKAMVAAARRRPTKDGAMQTQGTDFVAALTMSGWDAHYFGQQKAGPYQGWMYDVDRPDKNRLFIIMEKLSHYPVIIPGTPAPPPPPPPPPPPDPLDGGDLPTGLHPGYIDPYAARGFYEARHVTPPVVPGGGFGV